MRQILELDFVQTDDNRRSITLDQIVESFNGSRPGSNTRRGSKTRRQIHQAVLKIFKVEFRQFPGHDEISPIGKYVGLRERTAKERFELLDILISTGTNHECVEMTRILTKPKEFNSTSTESEFLDVKKIVTGRFENLGRTAGKRTVASIRGGALCLSSLPECTRNI